MSLSARTTVASLCYESVPGFTFESLLSELATMLRESGLDPETSDRAGPGVALFRLGGLTLALAVARAPETTAEDLPAACVTLAAGPGGGLVVPRSGLPPAGTLVSGGLARLAALAPPSEIIWTARHEPPGAELAAAIAARIWPAPGENGESFTPRPAALPDPDGRQTRRRMRVIPGRKPRAVPRPVRDLAAEAAAARSADSLEPANSLPALPGPQQAEAARLRAALYAEDPAEPARAPVVRRLAVTAMNCTLVLVSAPIGAAMLTHQVLRGQSFATAGRTLALTATAVGLGDLFLQGGLPLI